MMNHHDVICLGAGVVGLATTLGLAQQGYSVCLIDYAPPLQQLSEQAQLRVSAINLASLQLLKKLGLDLESKCSRFGRFKKIQVYANEPGPILNFSAQEIRQTSLGIIVENCVLQYFLMQEIAKYSTVSIVTARPNKLDLDSCSITLGLNTKERIKASMLLAADGANSWVRDQLSIENNRKPYDCMATVANIRCEKNHQAIARQRFLDTGPLALLPLASPQQCSIVWSNELSQHDVLAKMDEVAFNQALQAAFGESLGQLQLCSERVSFPLVRQHAEHYISERVVLLGDAAHTIHPLAGQGLNLGLQDVQTFLQVQQEAKHKNKPIGYYGTLRKYERARKKEVLSMLAAMDFFHLGFSARHPWARQFLLHAMGWVDDLSVVKRLFTKKAVGLV